MNTGTYIRLRRKERGLSLRSLADQAEMSAAYLSAIERNKMLPPSVRLLTKIARVLGINPDSLIIMAGKLPPDVEVLIKRFPFEICDIIRYVGGLTSDERAHLINDIIENKNAV